MIASADRVLTRCTPEHLYTVLGEQTLPTIRSALERAGPGQRLRVTTLPEPVMDHLCAALHENQQWAVRKLVTGAPRRPWEATATKVIELRNALVQPLLVLVPPELRTAAEDSLDIATFTDLAFSELNRSVVAHLLGRVSEDLRVKLEDALAYLRLERIVRNADQETEYLLTVIHNGATPSAAGGALFVFGLIPDYELFHRTSVRFWLSRNEKARGELADIRRPLQERIAQLPLQPDTLQKEIFYFLRQRHTDDSTSWAADIGCRPECQHLSLDHWAFADSTDEAELRLIVEPLTLPLQKEDPVGGAARMPVLDLDGKQGLKVVFRSLPPPSQVAGWKTFRIQILSAEGDHPSVAWESNSFPKPAGRQKQVGRTIKPGDLHALDEGTYFVKVDAYDQSGAILTRPRPIDSTHPKSRAENESELFLIIRGGSEVDVPQPRAVMVPSLFDAWMMVCEQRLSGREDLPFPDREQMMGAWMEPIGGTVRGDVHFRLDSPDTPGFTVVMPGMLRKIELATLEHPEYLGMFRLNFSKARTAADVPLERRETVNLPATSEVAEFHRARKAAFDALRQQHIQRHAQENPDPARTSTVETADLLKIKDAIDAYAVSFIKLSEHLLNPSGGGTFPRGARAVLAQLDVVEVNWRRAPGDPGRALLLSPTHPLRMLWHLQHAAICEETLSQYREGGKQAGAATDYLAQLRRGLLPANLPMVLFDDRARAYVEQGVLTPYWSAYLPDRVDAEQPIDVASTRDTLRQLLGMRGKSLAVPGISSNLVAVRIIEYLLQHPYAEQLRLNVFNPGDGQLVADSLRLVEQIRRIASAGSPPPPLRYSVQMFGAGEQLEAMGEAVESLLDPDRQVAEDDEFTLASANHLLPKLVFGRNVVGDFLRRPDDFPAHISIFLEHFNVRCRLGSTQSLARGSYVSGLVQEPDLQSEDQPSRLGWYKGLRPVGRRQAAAREQLIERSVDAAQRLCAALAAGEATSPDMAPVVALQLDSPAQALLKHVHSVSDWVLTIDRHLGVEYFDSPSSAGECGYLLDFIPESLQEGRQRLMLTTRSTIEVESIVRPALDRFGLRNDGPAVLASLEALRSLSGRLALKLVAAPNHSAEVVGLLLARLLLEDVGLLEDRIIIPLDAHRGWFTGPKDGDPAARQQRADLLLAACDAQTRTIDFTIVEVKLREELTDAGREMLYREMREQADNTITRLRGLFDPELYAVPRPDMPLRIKELTTVLSFYVRRARRYGILSPSAAAQALQFAQELDSGYSIATKSIGIVFERKTQGVHLDESEPGFSVHRFGLDVARQLYEDAVDKHAGVRGDSTATDGSGGSGGLGGGGGSGGSGGPGAGGGPDESGTPSTSQSKGSQGHRRSDHRFDPLRSTLSGSRNRQTVVKAIPQPPSTVAPPSVAPLSDSQRQVQNAPAPSTDPITAGRQETTPSPAEPRPTAHQASSDDHLAPMKAPAAIKQSPMSQPAAPAASPGALLGANNITAQYGVLGRQGSTSVAIDLTGCNTISLFGVQGFGKSYTLGVIAEMAVQAVQGINVLPAPLATVIFHYHKSDAYPPELVTATRANHKASEVERLAAEYGVKPQGLRDVLLLTPEGKVEERRRNFPGIEVQPIKFNSAELGAESWKFLLGAYGNDSFYIRQLVAIMRRHRDRLTIAQLEQEIRDADLPPATRRLAEDRIALARPYIDDQASLRALLRPGRMVIIDLRDEWIEREEALGLFVVMMRIFATSKHNDRDFNKLVVFDEAHKYITESELIGQVVETIREMRHQATSVVIASQDPLSVPRAVVELTSVLIMHRMTSPQWLKHLKSAISALSDLSEDHLGALQPGEALVWAQRCTDKRFVLRPQKVSMRPRFSQHGGGTRTAVDGGTIR